MVEASRHADLFCSGQGTNILDMPPEFREFFGSMINMDDPRHARLRQHRVAGLHAEDAGVEDGADVEATPPAIDRRRSPRRDDCDFVTEVAALLPLRVIVDLMGIPRSQETFIFDRTNRILGFLDPEYVPEQDDRGR